MPPDLIDFIDGLETEKNILHTFIEFLKKEENVLTQGKINEIDQLSSEKLRLIDELMRLDNRRNSYLQAQKVNLEKSAIDDWLIQQDINQAGIKSFWDDLIILAKEAHRLNQSNGLIISNYLQHNQRAYAALHSAAGNISLYGPKGQTYI